ncbi:MAG: SRPBCC domain-containing protein [Chloroflexota bacterium]
MKRLLEDEILVDAPRDRLWELVDDLPAIQRILPGCEELEQLAPNRYRAVMRTKIQFITLRVQGTAELVDLHPPDHVRLAISGRPIGLIGSFVVSVPIDVTEADGQTRAVYAIELELTGRLAAFGAPILRATVKAQVREMMENLRRELLSQRGDASAAAL